MYCQILLFDHRNPAVLNALFPYWYIASCKDHYKEFQWSLASVKLLLGLASSFVVQSTVSCQGNIKLEQRQSVLVVVQGCKLKKWMRSVEFEVEQTVFSYLI